MGPTLMKEGMHSEVTMKEEDLPAWRRRKVSIQEDPLSRSLRNSAEGLSVPEIVDRLRSQASDARKPNVPIMPNGRIRTGARGSPPGPRGPPPHGAACGPPGAPLRGSEGDESGA